MKDKTLSHAPRAHNVVYKFLITVFCGPLGKGVWKELPDFKILGTKQTKCTLVSNQFLNILNLVGFSFFIPSIHFISFSTSYRPSCLYVDSISFIRNKVA